MKPDLPTNCREHANGRVREIERRFTDDQIIYEFATFLCGCTAHISQCGELGAWQLDESTFWKEGQA